MTELKSQGTMSDLDRLHETPISDEEFDRRLAEAEEEEVDEESAARILAAEAEQGEIISHDELKRRLGL